MTAPTPATPEPHAHRYITPRGNEYWGDLDEPDLFDTAVETFPILAYVLQAYFGSPDTESRDHEFIAAYEDVGETSAEFEGFMDNLTDAIAQWRLSSVLVNGTLGTTLEPALVRRELSALKDQLLHQGQFAPPDSSGDPLRINSAPTRLSAVWTHHRAIPGTERTFPMWLYATVGAGLALVGYGVTYIPVIGGFGTLLIILGGLVLVLVALGILELTNRFNNPEQAAERDQAAEGSPADRPKRRGLLSRINPFGT